jgi:hypothetical protein
LGKLLGMTIEKQNEFLLSLVNRLFLDLGAHLSFVLWVKILVPSENIDGVRDQARLDSELKAYVDAYMQGLSTTLRESVQSDPDRVYREFLRQWTPQAKVN